MPLPTPALPPPWLVYATPSIALGAFMIATASLLVAFLTYRRAAPRVFARYNVALAGQAVSNPVAWVIVRLQNRGLAPVSVDSVHITRTISGGVLAYFLKGEYGILKGEELPITLAPNSSVVLMYELYTAYAGGTKITDSTAIVRHLGFSTVAIGLGNGQIVKATALRPDGFSRATASRSNMAD